ncbi:MAG: glycosyl hydrolase family 18 protein, partial [Bacilli bacterium]
DWESSVDADNYTLMIKELNKQVKANNSNHLVVSTVGGGPWHPNHFNTSDYIDYVDLLNLMTYDMQVGYSRHQGALYAGYGAFGGCSVDETVSLYNSKGVPLNKMIVGIAFYGRQYDGSEGLSDGGTVLDDTTTAHSYSYLATNYLNNASEASSLFFDDECGVPYIFNSTTGVFITYENNQSIQLKCQYVKDNQMAGVMFWQYSQDNGDLIDAISDYQTLYKN